MRKKINSLLPQWASFGYVILYVHTKQFIDFLAHLSEWKHVDRWNDIGIFVFVGMTLLSLVTLLALSFQMGSALLQDNVPEPTAAQDPVNLIAIPGLNEFLPLSAAVYIVLAIVITAGVHEFAHGVAMIAEDIELTEVGVGLFFVLPIAAYVQPDDDAFESASSRSQLCVFCAGVFANVVAFVILTGVFLLPGTGSPITAFLFFFESIIGTPGDQVPLSISPLTNLLFWLWFFNINLAFVNSLPIGYLDGGRVIGVLYAEYVHETFGSRLVSRLSSFSVGFPVLSTVSKHSPSVVSEWRSLVVSRVTASGVVVFATSVLTLVLFAFGVFTPALF